jgi:hypothetical protein
MMLGMTMFQHVLCYAIGTIIGILITDRWLKPWVNRRWPP